MIEIIERSPLLSQSPLGIAVSVTVFVAFVVVAGAIVLDFKNYHRQDRRVVGSDSSLVETGSMTAFFLVYYVVLRLGLADVPAGGGVRATMVVTGMFLVLLGCAFNVTGRLVLKSSWANQIRVYEGQRLLTNGPFAVVRHPLYASLIWMFIGGSLIYANPLALALTLGVFVPMMYVRAKKEDALLEATFAGEFAEYKSRTGMFLPKVRWLSWRT